MANSNFVVQNGLTVGTTTIFAGNGDVVMSGNISTSSTTPASFTNLNIPSTLTATTINAGTIGNSGATLTGTLSTASQPNVTTLAGLTSFGTSGVTTTSAGPLIVAGNLTVQGTQTTVNTETILTTEYANIIQVSYINGNNTVNSGNITIAGNITPNANVSYNLGSPTAWFNNFYGVATQAKYADLAENYQADKFYNPGTVLMFGGVNEVTVADADTTRVAGVVSTNPAHLMNGALNGPNVIPVAFTGRVPCQVIGPVAKGDLMVSAGFGYAKVNNTPAVGTVVGKALQDFQIPGKGVIEVVVGRF